MENVITKKCTLLCSLREVGVWVRMLFEFSPETIGENIVSLGIFILLIRKEGEKGNFPVFENKRMEQ